MDQIFDHGCREILSFAFWAAVADTVIGGRILPKPKSICFTIIHNKKQANYSIINIYGK